MTARSAAAALLWHRCAADLAPGVQNAHLFGWEITARDGAGWLQIRNPSGGISLNIKSEDAYEPPVWPSSQGVRQTSAGPVTWNPASLAFYRCLGLRPEVTDEVCALVRSLRVRGTRRERATA